MLCLKADVAAEVKVEFFKPLCAGLRWNCGWEITYLFLPHMDLALQPCDIKGKKEKT